MARSAHAAGDEVVVYDLWQSNLELQVQALRAVDDDLSRRGTIA
jgi:hypothetical protein